MGLVAEMVLAQPHICKRDLVPSPAHLHLDQTDNFSPDTVFPT